MRKIVRMHSTADTGHFYTMMRHDKGEKLELMRWDPVARKHVKYIEKGKLK